MAEKSDKGFTALGYILWGIEISQNIYCKLRAAGCPLATELIAQGAVDYMDGYIAKEGNSLIYFPSYKEAFELAKTGIPIANAS